MEPDEFLLESLEPIAQEQLVDRTVSCPILWNTVCNVKLNPSQPIPLTRLIAALPSGEIKSGFGAGIARFTHNNRHIPGLEPRKGTLLTFASGAISGAGSRSDEEALLGIQEYRLFLEDNLGLVTDCQRFGIVNRVFVNNVGYPIDLDALAAARPETTLYEKHIFPGLFLDYTVQYRDRTHYNSLVAGSTQGRTEIFKHDLEQIKENCARQIVRLARAGEAGSSNNVELQHERPQSSCEELLSPEILEKLLPREKSIMLLVFPTGNIVVLGVDHMEEGKRAFHHAGVVCRRFRMSEEAFAQHKLLNKQARNKTGAARAQRGRRGAATAGGRGRGRKSGQAAEQQKQQQLEEKELIEAIDKELQDVMETSTTAAASAPNTPAAATTNSTEPEEEDDDPLKMPTRLSARSIMAIQKITQSVSDKTERRRQITEILQAEKEAKRARKRSGGKKDGGDEDVDQMAVMEEWALVASEQQQQQQGAAEEEDEVTDDGNKAIADTPTTTAAAATPAPLDNTWIFGDDAPLNAADIASIFQPAAGVGGVDNPAQFLDFLIQESDKASMPSY